MWFRRRAIPILIASALFGDFCAAQFSSSQTQSTAAHVLTGTVLNASNGEPIPFALVQADQNAKLSDQNGNFRFERLTGSSISVQAHKPGFFQEQEIYQQPPRMLTLSDLPTSITVALIPEAVISGHAENPEGEPLGGLPVRLRFSQIVNGRRTWQEQGHRQTDSDGNFRIAELKPGTYFVEVGPNPRPRPLGDSDSSSERFEVVPAEYYPGVREISAATPIHLIPGQRVALEFSMKRVPAFRVSGAITGMSSGPGGLALVDRNGDSVNVGVRFDSRTGRFQGFPVPAGNYRLRFNGHDSDGQQLFADVPIEVNGDIPELRIPVERTRNVPVEFETEFTKQSSTQAGGGIGSGAGIGSGGGGGFVGRRGIYGQIHLTSRVPPYQQFRPSPERPGGEMAIRGIEPGTYDVEVDSNNPFAYVASITCGGVDLLREPLVIAEGADPQPIDVVLRDNGASLDGSVKLSPGDTAVVVMVDDGDGLSSPRQIFVNPSGSFHSEGIPPGTYNILAFDRVDGIEYRNRDALRDYLGRAAHVTLGAEEQAKVTVDLIRTKP